jgi:integrase
MRHQKGYIFHRGKSWFVRYCDDVLQSDGTIKRKLVCKKLDVEYGGAYRTNASVKPFVAEVLKPVNNGTLDVRSTMPIIEFVERIYLPNMAERGNRASTRKGYCGIWKCYIKGRLGAMTLRAFRTVDGERMLSNIARQTKLGRHSLKHIKSFLSGIFKQAKRLGILDGVNPMQDVSIPHAPEAEETHAYNLDEVKAMLAVLEEPAWTAVLTAALTGLRKGEIRGLTWDAFDGAGMSVKRSFWNSVENEPKTNRSKASIPVVKQLAEALEAHRQRTGKQSAGPIFKSGNGNPLNLDNLARRVIIPAISRCVVCRKQESEHKPEGHIFERDKSLPQWHGWHAFRRGLATNLHALGVDDKTIQAILRHSNVNLTMNVYVKSVSESQVSAMDTLGEKLGNYNDLATPTKSPIN